MITKSTAIAGALFATFAATAATATPLTITITNTQGEGGLAIAPFYTAFHNASFDAFEEGEAASAGLEQLAELGGPGLIASEPGCISRFAGRKNRSTISGRTDGYNQHRCQWC